uniref:Peptidase S1 domain-containing protein n=1 Tax=Glossina brevipalpis TaxID=37001 RepID=A0A1A9WU93_9MUSC
MFIYLKKIFIIFCVLSVYLKYSSGHEVSIEKSARQANKTDLGFDDISKLVAEKKMPSDKPTYLVRLTWFDQKERRWEVVTGVILKEDIILTQYAPDLSNTKSVGYCLLTFNSDGVRSKDVRIWKQAARRYDSQKKDEYYITLVKLITKIDLNGNFMSLSIFDLETLPNCGERVIVFTPSNNEFVYTVANMSCKHRIGGAFINHNDNRFCITVEKKPLACELTNLLRGSPVLYDDQIIGVADHNVYLKCDTLVNKFVHVGEVIKHKLWIKETIEKLRITNIYSAISKHMVFYGVEQQIKGVAVIIDQKHVLTNYASDGSFYNRFHFRDKVRTNSSNGNISDSIEYGFIVHGTPNLTIESRPPADNVITYKKRLPTVTSSLNANDIKLIELDKDITFYRRARPIPLLEAKYPLKGAHCYVVTPFTQDIDHIDFNYKNKFSFLEHEMKLSEIEVDLWTYAMCKDYVKYLTKDQFCMRIHREIDERDHCRYIRSGTPVICDSMLVGIVNELKSCSQEMPRPCTNIHPYKEWINSKTREAKSKPPKFLEVASLKKEL